MNRRPADDPRPLLAVVLVGLCLLVASHVEPWLRRLDLPQLRAIALTAAVVLVALVALIGPSGGWRAGARWPAA
jgi:hypothetical protein